MSFVLGFICPRISLFKSSVDRLVQLVHLSESVLVCLVWNCQIMQLDNYTLGQMNPRKNMNTRTNKRSPMIILSRNVPLEIVIWWFLAKASYARRGLSYNVDVIDLFIYLVSSLTFFWKCYCSWSCGPILIKLGLKYSLEPRP